MREIAFAATNRRAGGRIRAEVFVRLLLVAILVGILLERTLYYQEQVERSIMEATIINIRSGMRWHIADLMTRHRSVEVPGMRQQNPVRWLQLPPVGYVGAFAASPEYSVPGGSWYFDESKGELVYVPRLTRFLESAEGTKEVRFKVLTTTSGADILPVRSYKWF